MSRSLAISIAVLTDALRRKVVWIVLLFAGLLALVIPSLPSYGIGVVESIFREVSIALMFAAALAVSLSLAATRIPNEIDRRTVFTVLARDVTRREYLVATWLGLFAVVGIVIVAYTVLAIIIGALTYSTVMLVIFQAAFAIWLEMGVIMAVTVLLSTRFGAVTNVLGSLVFVFIGHSIGTLYAGGDPHVIPPWWLPSLDVFNVIDTVAHGSGYGALYGLAMLGVFAALAGLLLLGGSAVFARRDL